MEGEYREGYVNCLMNIVWIFFLEREMGFEGIWMGNGGE
jgi:hypothetical protein